MLELLLTNGTDIVDDDSGLPYPAGTPYKGVVSANKFITGSDLANQLGLKEGTLMNNSSGWLHFIEDSGFEIYIAKKPIRYGVSWQAIDTAQKDKVLTIKGRRFTCEFMTGTLVDPSAVSSTSAGGEWNRYMYNVYKGEGWDTLPDRLDWGNYTSDKLGIQLQAAGGSVRASGQWVKAAADGQTNGYITRGRNGSGSALPITAVWYGRPADVAGSLGYVYGWRPMLVLEGSRPVVQSPFKGEVTQANFITFSALVNKIQTDKSATLAGTAKSQDDVWLKFEWNGKTLYMPRKPIRHSISDTQLKSLGLFTGSYTIVIDGKTYKVRCPTGTASDSNCEWNNLIYRIYSGSDTVPNKGTWASYTTAQLDQTYGTGNGNMCICQGTSTQTNTGTLTRGGYDSAITGAWYMTGNGSTNSGYAWRPVLELVS